MYHSMGSLALIAMLCCSTTMANAQDFSTNTIYHATTGEPTSFSDVMDEVAPGIVIFMGEFHGLGDHHWNQIQVIKELQDRGFTVSVGMEHFSYLDQNAVDLFVDGTLTEEEFLHQIHWGSTSFDYYRIQTLLPGRQGGVVRALNAPRTLTGKVAKSGMSSLTPDEREILPPQFTMGRDLYRQRFEEISGGHGGDNYFVAQSIWDDTMAWQIVEHFNERPNDVLVVIVGIFHIDYFGGLPARTMARGHHKVMSIAQDIFLEDDPVTKKEKMIFPHVTYGARGDYVWISDGN